MREKEIDRWRVVENLRAAAMRTGFPSASPTASGSKPNINAAHFTLLKTMIVRENKQIETPRKNVRRRPMASVKDPTSKVIRVIAGAQPQPTSTPAF